MDYSSGSQSNRGFLGSTDLEPAFSHEFSFLASITNFANFANFDHKLRSKTLIKCVCYFHLEAFRLHPCPKQLTAQEPAAQPKKTAAHTPGACQSILILPILSTHLQPGSCRLCPHLRPPPACLPLVSPARQYKAYPWTCK